VTFYVSFALLHTFSRTMVVTFAVSGTVYEKFDVKHSNDEDVRGGGCGGRNGKGREEEGRGGAGGGKGGKLEQGRRLAKDW